MIAIPPGGLLPAKRHSEHGVSRWRQSMTAIPLFKPFPTFKR